MRRKPVALLLGLFCALFLLIGSGIWRILAPVKPDRRMPATALDTPAPAIKPTPERSGAAPATMPMQPQFDIVRVEGSGAALVAGRAPPNTKVALMAGEDLLAEDMSDAAGFFVLQPPALAPGVYDLTLRISPKSEASRRSRQSVTVAVPEKGKGDVMVALAEPGKATVLLSDPTAAQSPVGRGSDAAQAVKFKTAEVQPDGGFFATGTANPRAMIRLYLNATPLPVVTAGPDGRWSLKLARSLTGGHYTLRADEIDPSRATVLSRAEIPFDFGAATARTQPGSSAARDAAASAKHPRSAAKSAALGEPSSAAGAHDLASATVTVARGDSLWRISQKILGKGEQYTQIYAANSAQIRDPHKIYPGQIFAIPKDHD